MKRKPLPGSSGAPHPKAPRGPFPEISFLSRGSVSSENVGEGLASKGPGGGQGRDLVLQRAGRLVSKEQIVDHLCEWGEEVSHNAIEVYVHRLRKKIEESDVVISTVRGLGYCLQRPVAHDEVQSA